MLEILGQQILAELRRVPHHKAVVVRPPRHDRVRRRIVDHVVRLAQERRRRDRRRAAVWIRARRRRRRSGVRHGAVHRSILRRKRELKPETLTLTGRRRRRLIGVGGGGNLLELKKSRNLKAREDSINFLLVGDV